MKEKLKYLLTEEIEEYNALILTAVKVKRARLHMRLKHAKRPKGMFI